MSNDVASDPSTQHGERPEPQDISEPNSDDVKETLPSTQSSFPPSQGSITDVETEVKSLKSVNTHVQVTSKQGDGLCQTFKMDRTGIMRPRQPADMFRSSSPGARRTGYVANRRNANFAIHEDGCCSQKSQSSFQSSTSSQLVSSQSVSKPARSFRRMSSLVKLAMDEEGKAEVTARTGETPSPPHQVPSYIPEYSQARKSSLRRSLSAVETGRSNGNAGDILKELSRRKSLGRSRDSRTWEFYCDTKAGEELNVQAEREQSGSAAAAIGLIRSHSNKVLTPNANKRNAKTSNLASSKRMKAETIRTEKPKLERATSSLARMETTGDSNRQRPKQSSKQVKHKKSSSQTALFKDFDDGDSDKENWAPGTQTRPGPRRRPVTNQESARILLESLQEPSESSSQGDTKSKGSSKAPKLTSVSADKENAVPGVHDEVAAFMGQSVSVGQEDDLDCVQSLLSLSQATWV